MFALKKITFTVIALGSMAACAHNSVPSDVRSFVEKRDLCDHLRGEIPDPENPEGIEQAIEDINQACMGTDAALRRLNSRYAAAPTILQMLSRYEDRIEASAER